MAIAKQAGVRTENDFVQESLGDSQDRVETVHALGKNDVQLDDGRVVTMRKTNGLDDTRIDAIIYDAYASFSTGSISPSITLRCQALNAIAEVDGRPVKFIQNRQELEDLMARFATDDLDTIAEKYLEVIGKRKKLEQAIKEMQEATRAGTSF